MTFSVFWIAFVNMCNAEKVLFQIISNLEFVYTADIDNQLLINVIYVCSLWITWLMTTLGGLCYLNKKYGLF